MAAPRAPQRRSRGKAAGDGEGAIGQSLSARSCVLLRKVQTVVPEVVLRLILHKAKLHLTRISANQSTARWAFFSNVFWCFESASIGICGANHELDAKLTIANAIYLVEIAK